MTDTHPSLPMCHVGRMSAADQNKRPSRLPPRPLAGEGWGEGNVTYGGGWRMGASDPQATDDIGKGYVSFMIPKLPVRNFG
ncbi:hypothetical protein SCT_3138 [Sulfuricella sp. T08]|nr:hypothetical protein SCT_3138 [Sulfuricella sp. T08]